ncbi:ABC transporter ATP-binding protein [Syntrophobacter fumaroxidans]|uniref:ABC transporter related n=1 Tax=Syntrophobacter fumaroxidans (strain DSM 10017 / MPOB) TaxID=335543 RepID=A0LG14_SYNFM|nr:ABC transporter ATP-binding protein [Syntrophobacter fumaroxidans]ABK16366.1 ABC transporter related [Syntrophobacter fumaroxidans MPOB]
MTNAHAPVIEARNITKRFGDFLAVDAISFDLLPGECLGLLGPNGAGKTSTIRMVYGFSPLTAGTLKIFGVDVSFGWRAVRFGIGVCQQDNNLDPDLTVLQNLEVFAGYFDIPRGAAREKADQLLRFMALDHRRNDMVSSLSGGMMRRMVLARALINDPQLLILDEPTTGLDPQSRHQVWEKLEKLRAQGLSILLTTHNMDEAARLCDRLIIMDHGKILVTGSPLDLVREYAGHHVLEILEPADELRAFVRARELMHDNLDHRLIIYGGENDRLFESIGMDYCGENCIRRMATLEDVFLRLTGRELRE